MSDTIDKLVTHWVRPEIRELSAYHVQPAAGLIKLDAMENPYTWPAELRAEWLALLRGTDVNRYPDPGARALSERLVEAMDVPAGMRVLLGNGSDELIQMIAMSLAGPSRSVLSVDPGFVMYRMIATFCGMRYVGVPLAGDDFGLDLPAVLQAMETYEPAVVFLAYPNNPTANLFDAGAVVEIIRAAPGLVVVDEAYAPFTDASFMPRLGEFDNLVVMRTVSKMGLAGLRLGLLAGPAAWLDEFDKVRLPYNINVLTQQVANGSPATTAASAAARATATTCVATASVAATATACVATSASVAAAATAGNFNGLANHLAYANLVRNLFRVRYANGVVASLGLTYATVCGDAASPRAAGRHHDRAANLTAASLTSVAGSANHACASFATEASDTVGVRNLFTHNSAYAIGYFLGATSRMPLAAANRLGAASRATTSVTTTHHDSALDRVEVTATDRHRSCALLGNNAANRAIARLLDLVRYANCVVHRNLRLHRYANGVINSLGLLLRNHDRVVLLTCLVSGTIRVTLIVRVRVSVRWRVTVRIRVSMDRSGTMIVRVIVPQPPATPPSLTNPPSTATPASATTPSPQPPPQGAGVATESQPHCACT